MMGQPRRRCPIITSTIIQSLGYALYIEQVSRTWQNTHNSPPIIQESTIYWPYAVLMSGHHQRMKWNESGFRPILCTYRLNWARITSWGWWDEWDDTTFQIQDSKFAPWRSEAEHATSWSRRLPAILSFTSGWGRNIFVSFKPPGPRNEPRTLAWKAAVLPTTPGPPPRATLSDVHIGLCYNEHSIYSLALLHINL